MTSADAGASPMTDLRTFVTADEILSYVMPVFRPPPDITVSEWADKYRRLSAESSAQPGRFRTEVVEYMREPMDVVGKPGVRRITIMSSAQVAKSTVLENVIGYFMHQDPCPILHVSPTLDSMKMFSKERLAPMVRDTPVLRKIVKDARSRDSGNTLASKALALDTPIPVPSGWTTMGELTPGDEVFAVDGSPCKVLGVSETFHNHDCYRVTFSDGDSVVADAGHLWEVCEWVVDKSGDKPRQVRKTFVKDTDALSKNYRKSGRFRYSLPNIEPIDLPEVRLPIDPYVLGIWLGDGYSHTNVFCCGVQDADEIASKISIPLLERRMSRSVRIFRFGDAVPAERDPSSGQMSKASHGTFYAMGELGVLSVRGRGNSQKHIPDVYLRSSVRQRIELLRGLMDSDGYALKSGSCGFSTVYPALANTFSELLASLGLRSSWSIQKSVFEGRRCKDSFVFSFASPDFAVFSLQRKIDIQFAGKSSTPCGGRRIVNVERVDSVPTRCILVDHPRHLFLAGRSMFPTHNTFPGGHIAMVGSNAPAGLASRPIRVVVADEVDRFESSAGTEGDPLSLAVKRTTTFWNRVIVFVSTPGDKGTSRIEPEFLRSDQRHRWCKCPHCGEMQRLRWSQVKWDEGQPDTAYYECEANGCVWNDSDRNRAVRAGEWRAEKPFNGNVGFHMSQLISPFAPLSEGVRDFLDAKGNPSLLKTWVNTFLGETWEEKGKRLEWSDLMDQREEYEMRENIPEEVTLITGAVDMQDDRAEVEFVGWGDDYQTWSLGYHKVYGDPSTPEFWTDLKNVLSETFVHPIFGELVPRSIAVDSGGHYTSAVYAFTQKVSRTVAIKGVPGFGKPMVGRPMKNTIGDARVIPLGVDTIKEIVVAHLKVDDPDSAGYCRFHASYDEDYFRGMTAEELRTKYHKGFPTNEWVKIRPRNEPFDLRVYNRAALEMLQVDLNAQRREALRKAAKRVNQEAEQPAKAKKPATRRASSWANRWKNG